MFYKPKFCCNCGEEIEETGRGFLASGRFCVVCKDDFKAHEFLPRLVVAAGVLFGLFGIGGFLQPEEKSLNLATRQIVAAPAVSAASERKAKSAEGETNQSAPQTAAQPAGGDQSQINQGNSPPAKSIQPPANGETPKTAVSGSDPVFYCGAPTKKGNPCARRVKGGGRCWQHLGQTALLPAEKLSVARRN